MQLDADHCYRALKSRDARFDGQFFTAVKTTGIYCRPVCPAPTPQRKNVEFYGCAAAAQEAGFRPCLRCRPETSPGSPAWQGTSATVTRALRLIDEGALDEGSVEALALRLGMGGRHLRRLFMEHLGVTPIAVAQTRRLHFAKKLIDETSLSMGDIAFNAGYSSIRRFNAAFRDVYGRTPRELRRQGREEAGGKVAAPLRLFLTYRPPYDWDALLDFFRDRATAGVESVEEGTYLRTIEMDGVPGWLRVRHRPERNALELTIHLPAARGLHEVTRRVRRMFDLECHPLVIERVLSTDPLLRPLIRKHPGLRVPGAWDSFELAVRVILGQQISVKGATTLAGRIAQAYGRPVELAGVRGLSRLTPRPEDLVDADFEGLGVVRARVRAIQNLARAVLEGSVTLDGSADFETVVGQIVAIPGLGPWSAEVIAMRALREPDAFPASDLGILRAFQKGEKRPSAGEVMERAEAWRPWRAYGALYLWKIGGTGAPKRGTKAKKGSRKN